MTVRTRATPTRRARSDAGLPSPTSLTRAAMTSSTPPRVARGGLRETRGDAPRKFPRRRRRFSGVSSNGNTLFSRKSRRSQASHQRVRCLESFFSEARPTGLAQSKRSIRIRGKDGQERGVRSRDKLRTRLVGSRAALSRHLCTRSVTPIARPTLPAHECLTRVPQIRTVRLGT